MLWVAITVLALPVLDYAANGIAQRIAEADPAVCLSRFVDYPPSKGKQGFPRCLWEKPFPTRLQEGLAQTIHSLAIQSGRCILAKIKLRPVSE